MDIQKTVYLLLKDDQLEAYKPKISKFTCPNLFSTSWLLQKKSFLLL